MATVRRTEVEQAVQRLGARLPETPTLRNATLDRRVGAPLYLKAELYQKTASYKVRGMLHRLLQGADREREGGWITVSAGNAAAALAWSAAQLGGAATVVMPAGASSAKIAATRAYGGEVILTDGDLLEVCEAERERRGATFVHPFDNRELIAGHGGVGLELERQAPEIESLYVPVGGGGLISGVLAALRERHPKLKIIGVEPRGAAVMSQSLAAGRVERLSNWSTIADGLAAPFGGENTLAQLQAGVDEMILVEEEEIVEATRLLWSRAKLAVEPSAAVGLAVLLRAPASGPTSILLSGGNVDAKTVCGLFHR